MNAVSQSAGNPPVTSSTAETGTGTPNVPASSRAPRDGSITIAALINAYMAQYAGRDPTRPQRLAWWIGKLGHVSLSDLTDDLVAEALDNLAEQRGRYWAGIDADGKAIYRAKKGSFSGASVNRYAASLSAVLTWSNRKRIAPLGWVNPMSGVERRPESRGRIRFLSDKERDALIYECRRSVWKKLYVFVLLALTTGARRGELEGLRWRDVDLDQGIATIHHTINNDPRLLPLVPAVVEELKSRGYTETEDELGVARGQISTLSTAEAFYQGRISLYCRYDEFTEDVPLNRLLRAAGEFVAGSRFDDGLRRRAKRILARMGDVSGLQTADLRAAVDRVTYHYKTPVAFAKYILRRTSVQGSHGERAAWSFLIRTPDLVEAGIRAVLRDYFRTKGWAVRKQSIELVGSGQSLNPDLVFGEGTAIADIKYKLATSTDWERNDLYQVTAFATGFRSVAGGLIAFQDSTRALLPPNVKVGDLPLNFFAWDADPETEPDIAGKRLAGEIFQWLDDLSSHEDQLLVAV